MKQKILLLSFVICAIVHSNYAMMVQLPEYQVLRQRLFKKSFPEFFIATEETSFNNLVGKKVSYKVAIKKINDAFNDYFRYQLITIKSALTLSYLEDRQRILAAAVLKDNPEALKKVLAILDSRKQPTIKPKTSQANSTEGNSCKNN